MIGNRRSSLLRSRRGGSSFGQRQLALGHLFVLYRGGPTCKVLTASVSLERMETLRGRLTKHAEAYAIARVPIVESW